MKKIFENIYLFSKLSTSLILFVTIIVMGYFFYQSYEKQDEFLLENKFNEKIQNNSNQLEKFKDNLSQNQISFSQIEKLLKDHLSNNNDNLMYTNELKKTLEAIQKNINILSEEVKLIKSQSNVNSNYENIANNDTNPIPDKLITDLINLILVKYENNLDFEYELNSLENIISPNKNIFIEKIRITARKPYKGQHLLESQFQIEMENYIKTKIRNNNNNFFYRMILPYVKIEPSQENIVRRNDSLLLTNIKKLIKEKKIQESLEKLSLLNEHEIFFLNTIEQSKIYIEFNKNLLELI